MPISRETVVGSAVTTTNDHRENRPQRDRHGALALEITATAISMRMGNGFVCKTIQPVQRNATSTVCRTNAMSTKLDNENTANRTTTLFTVA